MLFSSLFRLPFNEICNCYNRQFQKRWYLFLKLQLRKTSILKAEQKASKLVPNIKPLFHTKDFNYNLLVKIACYYLP